MTVTIDQTRADLEALYESVCKGWTCLGNPGKGLKGRSFGTANLDARDLSGGCLYHQMYVITENKRLISDFFEMGYNPESQDRRTAMVHALGFTTATAMYAWNDNPRRTWDDVKERVKDAIGQL